MTAAILIATSEPTMLDDLRRLVAAAGAGVVAEIVHDARRAVAAWHRHELILCGADLAAELAAAVPRRPGVVLVTTADDSTDVYRTAVEISAQDVALLPDHEEWLADAIAAAAEPAAGLGAAICVTGGRGGAGASVLAAGLGLVAARQGFRTLLIDGDPLGGGLDLTLGIEDAPGARWPDFAGRRGRLSATFLREALPALGELAVLSWHRTETSATTPPPALSTHPAPASSRDRAQASMPGPATGHSGPVAASAGMAPVRVSGVVSGADPDAMAAVLDAAMRGFDLVVVDVPRPPGEAGTVAMRMVHRTLLVVPAEVRGAVAADQIATLLRSETAEIGVVVRGAAPGGGLTPGMITEALALPLAGVLADDRRLAAALEHGDLPQACRRGRFADLCEHLISEVVAGTRAPGSWGGEAA